MAENKNNRPGPPPGRPGGPGRGPGGGRGPGRIVEKPKDFKGSMRRLIRYITAYRVQLVIVALFTIGSTVFSVQGPKILGDATTEVYAGVLRQAAGIGGIDFDALWSIIRLLILLYGCSAAFSFGQSYIMNGITQKIGFNLRNDINQKLHRLPMGYFDKRTHGEVLSYITNDVDTVTQGVAQSVTQIITAIATLLGVLFMMLRISVPMTAAILCVVPFSGIFVMQIVKRTQPLFKARQTVLARVNGIVEENYGGHTVVKAFNHEDDSIAAFSAENEQLYKTSRKSEFLGGLMHPMMDLMANLTYVMVAILGAWLASRGAITVGNIQSMLTYSRRFSQPINQISRISNQLQSTMAAAERVFGLLDEAEEPDREKSAADPETVEGHVAFDHVRFGYDPEKIIIHDLCVDVQQGRTVAIVGPTGAGKTTIVKLLMRFYDVQGGAIQIDGTDIRDFKRSDLRSVFGMVLQDTWLFSGTIRENIRYGRPEADDEAVYAAARAARADHFIRALPEGYDTVLNEEATNISQGQKQLLTIARAILADPKILILDEATSSVDTRTEIQIQKAMDTLMEGRTSFIIAHRLSTIRDADLILVMRDGDIVEQGNHETLLQKGGFYADLYNAQFENAADN